MPPLRRISTYLASKRILPLEGAFVRALENGRVSIHTESPFWEGPGNLRDARNSQSPVVNHCVLDECTNVRSLDLYIVSLVAYMCIL